MRGSSASDVHVSDFVMCPGVQEAHVFSTTDGMALQVFVVEGWTGDEV